MKKTFLLKTLIFSFAFCIFNFIFPTHSFLFAFSIGYEEKSTIYLEDDFDGPGVNMWKWTFFMVTSSYLVIQEGGVLKFIETGGGYGGGGMSFGISARDGIVPLLPEQKKIDKEYFYEFDIYLPGLGCPPPYDCLWKPEGMQQSLSITVMGPNFTSYTIEVVYNRIKGKYTKTVSFNNTNTTKILEKTENSQLPHKVRVSFNRDKVILQVDNYGTYSNNWSSTAPTTSFRPWIIGAFGNYKPGTVVLLDNLKTNLPLFIPPAWMTQPLPPEFTTPEACDNCPAFEPAEFILCSPILQSSSSDIEISEGTFTFTHNLPSTKSLNSDQTLGLTYNNLTANPSIAISTELSSSATNTSKLPDSLSYELYVGDTNKKLDFSTTADKTAPSFLWDAKSQDGSKLPTGVYPYKLYQSNSYSSGAESFKFITPSAARTPLVNRQSSPFGAGWSIKGLQQLTIANNGDTLLLEQSGNKGIIHDRVGEMSANPVAAGNFTASSIAFEPIKNILYAADTSADRIYSILPNGQSNILTGAVKSPSALVTDSHGNLFAAGKSGGNNPANIIFKVDPVTNEATRFVNTGNAVPISLASDQANSLLYALNSNGAILKFNSVDASSSTLAYDIPNPIAISHSQADGNLYLLQKDRLQRPRILQVTPEGKSYPFVTIPSENADIRSISIAPDGNIFALDSVNNNVLKIDRDGVPINYASTQNSQVASAKPLAMAINPSSPKPKLFISHRTGSSQIREISPSNTFKPAHDGILSSITQNIDGSFTRELKDKTAFNFSPDGLLTSVVDTNENLWQYKHDTAKNLTEIVIPVEKSYSFSYGTNGMVQSITDPANRVTELTHDIAGNLISIKNPDGAAKSFSYNPQHLLTSKTDELGKRANYTYNEQGRLQNVSHQDGTSKSLDPASTKNLINLLPDNTLNSPLPPPQSVVKDSNGNATTYKTNKFGNTIEKIDALGRTTKTERDKNSNPTRITYPNNLSVSQSYDERGNLLSSTNDFNQATSNYTYHPTFNKPISITDAKGNSTRIEYDNKGNLTKIIDPLNKEMSIAYNSQGLITDKKDGADRAESYTYNEDGNLSSIVDAEGGTTYYNYNAAGNVTSITDPEGRTTYFEYDTANRLTKTISPDGSFTENEYDAAGNLVKQHDQLNRETIFEYNGLYCLVGTTGADGNIRTLTYDKNGNLISATDPLGNTKTYEYNSVNTLTTFTLVPPDLTIRYQSDEMDNLIGVTNQNGKILQQQYDKLNRLTKRISPLGAENSYLYDLNGNIIGIRDSNNHDTSFEYDKLNRRTAQRNHIGSRKEFSYDEFGNLTSTKDENNNATGYKYDKLNRLTKVTDALNNDWTRTYDKVGNITARTDPIGRTASYAYDKLNRLASVTDALDNKTSFQYDAAGNLTSQTNAKNKTSNFEYDKLNRLTKIKDPLNYEKLYSYDPIGNLTSYTNSKGNATNYEYDKLNRLTKVSFPENKKNSYGYDDVGNLISVTDALNRTTKNIYDDDNRLVSVTDPLNRLSKYSYDPAGNLLSVTNPKGNITRNIYDELNRLTKKIEPDNAETAYQYDPVGNLTKTINALGKETLNKYDKLNRLIEITDAVGKKEFYAYDATGNQTSYTDKNNVVSEFVYDKLNRLTEKHLPNGISISNEYDELGNKTKIINGKGKYVDYAYDDLNRPTSETNALGKTKSFIYDGEGNMLSLTKRDGQTLGFDYDALNRKTKTTFPNGITENFSYDIVDNLQSANNNNFKAEFIYDSINRVTQATVAPNVGAGLAPAQPALAQLPASSLAYSYDENDNLTSLTAGGGKKINYGYDAADRLSSLSAPVGAKNLSADFTYNKLGRMIKKSTHNPLEINYTYDDVGNLIGIKTISPIDGQEKLISNLVYTYDAVGNRLSMTENAGSRPSTNNYTYDELNQLTGAQHGSIGVSPVPNGSNSLNFTENYSYDKNYNRVSSHLSTTYSYDDADRLLEDDNYTYTYDDNGNLTEKLTKSCNTSSGTSVQSAPISAIRVSCERMTFSYDADDHLTHVERFLNASATASVIANYYYDALDRRIAKEVNDVVTYYEWDGDNLLAEYLCNNPANQGSQSLNLQISQSPNAGDCRQISYYLHPAGTIDAPLSMLRGNFATDSTMGNSTNTHQPSVLQSSALIQHFYYVTDALNSVTKIVNSDGQVVAQTTYDSFGNPTLDEGFISNPYNFTGRQFDIETGLYYYRARYYDPQIGRFIQQDPLYAENLYFYADNNPVNYTDPSGLKILCEDACVKKDCSIDKWGNKTCVDSCYSKCYPEGGSGGTRVCQTWEPCYPEKGSGGGEMSTRRPMF